MNRNELLQFFKTAIYENKLHKTDKYFRLWIDDEHQPSIKENYKRLYDLHVYHWSDSMVLQSVFKKEQKDTKKFLKKCSELGAYIEAVEQYFKKNPSVTPVDIMKKYNIDAHVKSTERATGTFEEMIKIRDALIIWNREYIMSQHEMEQDTELNFIRQNRIKNKTAISSRSDIGSYFSSETSF